MSMKVKTLMRPKVRFSEQSESTDDSEVSIIGPFHGPKIKNIITLDKPVRLIHDIGDEENLTINEQKNINEKSTNITDNLLSISPPASCLTEKNSVDKISLNDNELEKNKKIPITKIKQNISEKCVKEIPNKSSIVEDKKYDNIQKQKIISKNFIESNKENVSQRSRVSQSKELIAKTESKLLTVPSSSLPSALSTKSKTVKKNENNGKVGQKLKPQSSVKPSSVKSSSSMTQMKLINSGTRDLLSKVKLPSVSTKSQLKTTTTTHRSKPQVRSEMAKNISTTKPNVYVGPGMPRVRTKSLSSISEKINSKNDCVTGNKLDRPEYNSIMFTINKLQEIKKKKIVTDFDSLPANYKNSCLKKMSSALDFPPDESIFHDLIDISINDKQLPLRLTRSKDPEPRQKDLEPRLSDFFTPQYANEYAEAVKIRPRSPQIVDNWSAFKISDLIFGWKESLNE